ncbi:MAG: efflux transporter outer membrane subunit [Burkholderiaceae bacterium]|nr:efflux transporter outer membrane subunit [Roseateles sp.]MBV8468436.1 efflux transporter outer membrane subunit [Burkholderiaceae bacterium]
MFKTPISLTAAAAVAALSLLSGCAALGPDFKAPAAPQQAAYRHAAGSADAVLPAAWWNAFGDATLAALEQRALQDSPSVKASAERLAQARAQLGAARAATRPQLGVSTSAAYERSSQNTSQAILLHHVSVVGMDYEAGASMSYELDAWGRVRRLVESASAQVQAAEDDHGAVVLTLSSQIANSYFQLRGLDAQADVLGQALASRIETEALVQSRFDAGVSNELDLSRARVETANARAQLIDVQRQRADLEHALAVLVGASPSEPLVPAATSAKLASPPQIPVGLPASLLAQRPDLAESVATLRALNAQVGVAEAAFYPSISLTASYGFASQPLSDLLKASSHQYSIGPLGLSLPIFDGGRNRANLAAAKARYSEAAANHEQRLLTALREVEDSLNDVQQLQDQALVQAQASAAAERAYEVARARWERGVSNYLDVTDAQRSALSTERDATQIATQRLLAAVAVARSLGGGWTPER